MHPLEQLCPRGDVGEGPGARCLQRQSRGIWSSSSINNADADAYIDVAISFFRLRRLRPARVCHGAEQPSELRPHGIVQIGIEKERWRRRGGRVDDGFGFADADAKVHEMRLGRGVGRPFRPSSSSELATAAAARAPRARGARPLCRWGLGAAAHVLSLSFLEVVCPPPFLSLCKPEREGEKERSGGGKERERGRKKEKKIALLASVDAHLTHSLL